MPLFIFEYYIYNIYIYMYTFFTGGLEDQNNFIVWSLCLVLGVVLIKFGPIFVKTPNFVRFPSPNFDSSSDPIIFTNSSEHQRQIGSPEMSRVNSARRLGANLKERSRGAWRIIPVSRWLTILSKSTKLVPLPNEQC